MITPPRGVRVFAVEDTSVQLTWGRTGVGEMTIAVDGRTIVVPLHGGPGCVDVTGLAPDRSVRLDISVQATRSVRYRLRTRTLPTPPGEQLDRIATLTDLHLGRRSFGLRSELWDPPGAVPHPVRCTDAAIEDLIEWGARHLFIKGDMVETSKPQHWAVAADVLADRRGLDGDPLPIDATVGNHERNHHSTVTPDHAVARHGIGIHEDLASFDRDGVRVVLLDSSLPIHHRGRWSHRADDVAALAATAPATLIVTHHQPQRWPIHPYFPPGVDRRDVAQFIRTVRRASPAVLGTSGHTHRHRRHDLGGVPWTETGSAKDYPGTWTGYVIHEGGIRQVVRRVSRPDALDWLDHSGTAVWGVWSLWSPGRLSDRCFTWRWPSR